MVYLVTISTFLILVLSLTTMFMLRSNNIKTNKIRLNTQQNKAYKAELRLAKNLMVIVFVFLIMVTPLLVCFIAYFLHKSFTILGQSYENVFLFNMFFYIGYLLFLCGTIWNFLVIVFRNKTFKKCLFKLFSINE